MGGVHSFHCNLPCQVLRLGMGFVRNVRHAPAWLHHEPCLFNRTSEAQMTSELLVCKWQCVVLFCGWPVVAFTSSLQHHCCSAASLMFRMSTCSLATPQFAVGSRHLLHLVATEWGLKFNLSLSCLPVSQLLPVVISGHRPIGRPA